MLKNLHRLRGLAALVVVISHLAHWHYTALIGYYDKRLMGAGVYAVGVFFVISGFIIARSHRRDIGSPGRIGSYAVKRFLRIYPAYWAYAILYLSLGALGFKCWDISNQVHRTPLEMVSAVFLAPVTSLPHGFLAVSWSLYYEILFYCVFAFFFFINRRLGYSVLVLFALASASIHTLPLTSPYCINRINLLFLAGVIMGLFSDSAFFKRLPPILLTTAGLLLYTISIIRYVPMNHPFIYAGAIMLVAAAVAADVRTEGKTATPTGPIGQPLMWLGSISYSLYLCHVPVQAVIYRYFGSPYSSPLIAILYILAPIGIASVGYLAIEAPSQKLARLILASDQSRPHPQSLRSIPLPTVAGIPTLELPFTSMAWQENRKRLARK